MFTVPTIFCKYIIKASLMEVKFQSFTIFRTKYFFMWKLGISESTYFFLKGLTFILLSLWSPKLKMIANIPSPDLF